MKNNLAYSSNGLAFTAQHEGCRYQAYQDSGGVWTCGYGHTAGVSPSTTCTNDLALEWLSDDTQAAVNSVNNLVTAPLTQDEFDALVDFVFNVGTRNFQTSTMLILINGGNYTAAAEQFQRWDLAKGVVIAGLLNRRNDEAAEFNTGE